MIWKITLWTLAVLSVVVAVYVLVARERLLQTKRIQDLDPSGPQWAVRWFAFWEPWEILLWRKSTTILKARFLMVTGAVLTVLTQTSQIDWTLLMPFLPDKWRVWVQFAINTTPLMLTVLGAMDEKLRRETKTPLDVLAVRIEDVPEDVRRAILEAEIAKAKVETVVAVAKEEGRVQA